MDARPTLKRKSSDDEVSKRPRLDIVDDGSDSDGLVDVPPPSPTKFPGDDDLDLPGNDPEPKSIEMTDVAETKERVRALHNHQMDRIFKSIKSLKDAEIELRNSIDQLNEWKQDRAEGMLRKLYWFMQHCRDCQALPSKDAFRTSNSSASGLGTGSNRPSYRNNATGGPVQGMQDGGSPQSKPRPNFY